MKTLLGLYGCVLQETPDTQQLSNIIPVLLPIPGKGQDEWECGFITDAVWHRANTRTSHSGIHIFSGLQPIPGRDRNKWECRLITDAVWHRANACTSHSAIIDTVLQSSLKVESVKNNQQGVR